MMQEPAFKNDNIQIYHCDCLDWLHRREAGTVKLYVTDPPYGLNYESDVFGKIEGDEELPLYWIEDAFRTLEDGRALYIYCHWKTWSLLEAEVERVGFTIKNMIVLKKSNHGRGDLTGQYAPKHELIMFATKGRHILRFPYKRSNDVLDVPWFSSQDPNRRHATEKPLSWYTQPIINSSYPGETVIDLFAGSGSCGEEALRNGRKWVGIDIDKKYVREMVERLKIISMATQSTIDDLLTTGYKQTGMWK
jgi:site-specific DNA-methyltransferase (adenine-specific)